MEGKTMARGIAREGGCTVNRYHAKPSRLRWPCSAQGLSEQRRGHAESSKSGEAQRESLPGWKRHSPSREMTGSRSVMSEKAAACEEAASTCESETLAGWEKA